MKNRFAGLSAVKELQNTTNKQKAQKPEPLVTPTKDIENIQPKKGRPNGKRSNSEFKQVTAYISLETYKKTKIRLFEENNKQEFSELVETLLNNWLQEK